MNIEFPGPAVPAEDGGISFRAKVDGETVACKFSWEALQDVEPANRLEEPMEQFEANQTLLLGIAEEKIRNGEVTDGVVGIFTADVHP